MLLYFAFSINWVLPAASRFSVVGVLCIAVVHSIIGALNFNCIFRIISNFKLRVY